MASNDSKGDKTRMVFYPNAELAKQIEEYAESTCRSKASVIEYAVTLFFREKSEDK